MSGEASGFRVRVCNIAPDKPRQKPAIVPAKMRGARTSKIINSDSSFPCPINRSIKPLRLIGNSPRQSETIETAKSEKKVQKPTRQDFG